MVGKFWFSRGNTPGLHCPATSSCQVVPTPPSSGPERTTCDLRLWFFRINPRFPGALLPAGRAGSSAPGCPGCTLAGRR
nr:MAG TPA: hypothetical protein [Caudoviricetes sp.]